MTTIKASLFKATRLALMDKVNETGQEIMAAQLFFCKIEQTLFFLSGEELYAHHRTG